MKTEKQYAEIVKDLSKSKEERIQAAFHLENAVDDENLKILCEALKTEPSPIVRHELAFALGETGHPRLVIPYLKEAIENDSNIFVRHEAILALATLGDKSVMPFIEKFLDDKDPEISESAEIAIQRLNETGVK